MKGQAFIVFRDISSATNAKHSLDNSIIFGNQMRVNYSKSISDVILQNTGRYTHKEKVKKDEERRKRRDQEYLELRKKTQKDKEKKIQTAPKSSKIETNVPFANQQISPNNILFIESLPADISEPILRSVFVKYNGFKEIRLYPGKGIAFVEYDNEINAGGALLGLNNLHLTADCVLRISFAKK
jgi:U2 small nuclear ribonucleoprotein B''